mgnify:CR=1 FL=1
MKGKKIIIELGSGNGCIKKIIDNKKIMLTDIIKYPWIDKKVDMLKINLGKKYFNYAEQALSKMHQVGSSVFGLPVPDPEKFGVIELDDKDDIIGIEEKPAHPKSNLIIPGMYFFIGGTKKGVDLSTSAPHHTPDFYVDDSALATGVRSMTSLALDYIFKN